RNLIGAIAFQPESHQDRADLRGGRLRIHDLRHRSVRALEAERCARREVSDRILNHRLASLRKFRRSPGPSGVRIDSGWNWTPSTGWFRCRTAMISPSSAVALTSRSRGKDPRTIARE